MVRGPVTASGRILALTYNSRIYLLAGRLPIDGFYAYFKWDADYAASPWFGRPHDLCTVLETAPPPVIELDEKGTWGFRPRSYIPCLNRVLTASYLKVGMMSGVDGDLYVRRDRSDQTIQHLIHDSPSGG